MTHSGALAGKGSNIPVFEMSAFYFFRDAVKLAELQGEEPCTRPAGVAVRITACATTTQRGCAEGCISLQIFVRQHHDWVLQVLSTADADASWIGRAFVGPGDAARLCSIFCGPSYGLTAARYVHTVLPVREQTQMRCLQGRSLFSPEVQAMLSWGVRVECSGSSISSSPTRQPPHPRP